MKTFLKKSIGHKNPIRLAWHYTKALLAAIAYRFPARNLIVIGITGTDGKTTTVAMLNHILQESNSTSAALSTAFVQIGTDFSWNETQKTSPSPFFIQKFLRDCISKQCTHVVMEVSSHGLVQGRLHYTFPTVGAITHISPEHLDYHGTMEHYIQDKGTLFRMIQNKGTKVLNSLDETYDSYKTIRKGSTLTWAAKKTKDASYSIVSIESTPNSSNAEIYSNMSNKTYTLTMPLPGSYNIENALCALCCAKAVGISEQESINALRSFSGLPGRMESIDEGQNFSLYVDFTVTPGAYTKTLQTLRTMIEPDKRILVLTGSCGDRMKEKRPQVGKICSTLADIVIVTNEDPYTEDPQKIINEVWEGINQSECQALQIFDRLEAIQKICSMAEEGDAVILCAKGSDTTMWTAEGQIPWNEREIAHSVLKSISGTL